MKKILKIILGLALICLVACQGEKEASQSVLAPMVRIKDELYLSTGYANSLVTCGTADGQITSTVPNSQEPQEDNQSNFGKGYDWQVWEGGYVNVKIGDQWMLFQNIAMNSNQIPTCVAHFKARVLETEEDRLLVQATEIDDGFVLLKRALTKPISLPIDNLDHAKDGQVTTQGLEGKEVEVWFDGKISQEEPEKSTPIFLGQIYKIQVLED